MKKPILCLDFDGVVHSYWSGWCGPRCIPDEPVEGAFDFIDEAMNFYTVAIHSARSRYRFGRRAMKKWMHRELHAYWRRCRPHWLVRRMNFIVTRDNIDRAIWDFINEIKWPLYKPPAHLTIDDRAMTFTGKFPSMGEIYGFRPWNRPE